MSLQPRQFDLWGGSEPYGPKPTGMKPPDVLERYKQAEQSQYNLPQSYRNRMSDDDYESNRETAEIDDEPFEEAKPHPVTKLPDRGMIDTEEDPIDMPNVNQMYSGMDPRLSYHAHDQSQRRKVGSLQEVPLDRIGTYQRDVSSQRLHEILANSDSQRNPRYPSKLQVDVPLVYHDPDSYDEHTVIDGNHRVAAAKMRNEMFTPARVVTNADAPALSQHSKMARGRRAAFGIDENDRWNRYFGSD